MTRPEGSRRARRGGKFPSGALHRTGTGTVREPLALMLREADSCCHAKQVFVVGVLPMEMLIWLGVGVAVAVFIWMAAPHHQRMIDSRPAVIDPDTWD